MSEKLTIFDFSSPMAFDMALEAPVRAMFERGIRVDMDRAEGFYEIHKERRQKYQKDLNRIAGRELNVKSPKQIKEFLYGYLDLPVRYHRKKPTTREEKLRSLMAECAEKAESRKTPEGQYRWKVGHIAIMLILKIREVRTRMERYIPQFEPDGPGIQFDYDGRARWVLSIGTAETARWSCSKTPWGTGCNGQTIPHELRAMFVADPGKVMFEWDLNRGESWIYSHSAEDPEMMEIHQSGGDFHAETAAAICEAFSDRKAFAEEIHQLYTDGDDWGFFIRYLGKRVNHASAYRMGPFKQAEVINDDADDTGITVTVGQCKEAQALWQAKYMMMPHWWRKIERQLNDDDNPRTLVTPYGRRRTFHDFWGDGLFKEATAHVPQSTSVDYLNIGLLNVYRNLQLRGAYGIELLHQNHDSILGQFDEGCEDEAMAAIGRQLTSHVEVNDYDLVIPVEGNMGKSWDGNELEEWGLVDEAA